MKQQQSLFVPPGGGSSLRKKQDQHGPDSPHPLQQQERQQEEGEEQQHQSVQQQHSGEQQEGRGERPQNSAVPQRVDTCTKKEEIQEEDKRTASGRSVTSAASFLRALWPGVRDTVATEEDNPKGESDWRSTGSKNSKEGHDFHAIDTGNNKLAAFFSPLGGRGTGRKRSTTGSRRLLNSTSLPSYSSAGGEVSSFPSSRRSGWAAAGLSAGAPLPFRPSSLFAGWLPAPVASSSTSSSSSSSSSTPHGVPSGSGVSSHSTSTTDTDALKKSWIAAGDSEAANWFASNKMSSSSDRMKKSPTKRAGRSSGRQAILDWRGDLPKVCVSDRRKTAASTAADPRAQRRQSQGSRSEAADTSQGEKNSSVEADPRKGAADDSSAFGVSMALAQAGRSDGEAGSDAGAATALGSTAAAEDSTSGHLEEEREGGKRRSSAAALRSRLLSEEKQLWEQQHAVLGGGMAGRHAVGYGNPGTVERRDIVTAIGARERLRDTKLQRKRRELAGSGSIRAQLFFSLHGSRNLRPNTMSQEQQRQPSSERHVVPAAAPTSADEVRDDNSKEREKESSAKEAGRGGEEEASSSSFGWVDQLRKVLKQTSLLGGNSTGAAKKPKSRQSGVHTPVTTGEETGTEEELSDSELLLLQGVSIAKVSEEAVQHASHGSEPCNVLVCVEPAAAATASSSYPVAAAAATVSSDGFKDTAAAAQVGVAVAPPCSPRSTASGNSSVQRSAESFSGLWEGTSFFPPSFASLAAAVNIHPWLAADAAVPLPCDAARSNDNASNNVSSSSSSDQSLSTTGRGPSDRSTLDSSSSSSARSSQPGAVAAEEGDMSTREDFESLFARCRSSVAAEGVPTPATAALPLHGVAVLRADGTTKTYWRVPVQLQKQQQWQQQQQQWQQQQQQWQQQQQQWQQQQQEKPQQSSNKEPKQSPQQEECGKQPNGDKAAASGAADQHDRAKEERDWMFIPLQQPIQETGEKLQRPGMQQQQQGRSVVRQEEDQTGHSQKPAQPAEASPPAGAVQHQREDREEQQIRETPESSIGSSSSSSSSNISSGPPQLDAWSTSELADVAAAGAAPTGSSNREIPDSSTGRKSDSTDDSGRCRRSSQEKIGTKTDNLSSLLRNNRDDTQLQSLQQQQSLQPEEDGTSTAARQRDTEEAKGAEFLGTKRRSVSAARGAKSWAQYKYNDTSQRRSRGIVEVEEQDMCGDERHSGSAAADHSRRTRRRAADGAGDGSPAEKAAAALGTAGAALSSLAGSPSAGMKRTDEGRTQQQPTGWWSEFSKGLADFFTQQQVDVGHCENPVSPGSSGHSAAAEQQQHHGEAAAPPLPPLYTPLGFSFSPAGLLGPYHLGVVSFLSEANVINEYTPVAGASAGSLAAVAVGLNLSAAAVMSSVEHVNQDLKEKGTAQRLGKRLRKELNKIVPEDCAVLLGKRPGKVTVTYTHVFPYIHGAFVSSFFGKSDLIDCLMASCNIPFYFSKWPTITCRGKQCVDGFFATKHKTFGCPDTGALRDVKVVPFYASTVRVSSAAQDCINPDLQMHDEQILHYLRAKALLRARARLLREQMQQQRQQQKGVHPQQAEGQQHMRQQHQQQDHAQKCRGSTSTVGSDDGSVLENSWLPLLPSVCPLHGVGRDGKKQQHGVDPQDTQVQTKLQSSAENDNSRSNVSAADQADGGDSCTDACTALLSGHADAAAETRGLAIRNKQHEREDGAVFPSSAVALGEDSTGGRTSLPSASSSLLTSAHTKGACSADAADVCSPATPPGACNRNASAFSQDAQFIPTVAVPPSSSSSPSSSDAVLLSRGALATPALSAAAGALPCEGAFPAAAVPLPAAAAAAAEVAAQLGEKVCAFETIYACPVCSPLGEICPPHHFSYYYHDPTSATFGCGAITTSATFNAEQAAAGGSTVAAAPPASASIATTTAAPAAAAAASRTTDPADAAGVMTLKPAARPDATFSVIREDGDIVGTYKPDTARHDAGSSSSNVTLDEGDVTAALPPSTDQFAEGKEPAGPVAALTTLGTTAGALKTAAEETLDADQSSKDNTSSTSSVNITNINRSGSSKGGDSGDDLNEVPAPLSAALSSIVPPHVPDVARTYSSVTKGLPASLADAQCSAPVAAADGRPARVSFLEHPRARDTTSLSAFSTSMTARSAGDTAPPVGSAASRAAHAAHAPTASATTATPAPTVKPAPAAAPRSGTTNAGSTSTTARQRRRLRACKVGGGLCMKEKCGCTALPPLLRLSCSTQELLQIALEASPNETLRELFDLGRADAFRWLVLEYMRCEDDLIHRRTAAAKAAHQQQQTPAADSVGDNAVSAGSTACSRGGTTSTSNTSRLTESSSSLMPALRQRWKLVSTRWGRSADSSSTKTTSSKSSRGDDYHHRSCASTPTEEKGGPALGSLKGEEHERTLSEGTPLPVTASPSPATISTEGSSHGTSQLAVQDQRGEQEKSLAKKQSTRRLRAPNAAEMLQSCASAAAAAPTETTVAACFGEMHVAAATGAEEDMPLALAPAEQTGERCAASPAPLELHEEALTLKHAATAPGECRTTSDLGDAAAASSLPLVHSGENSPPIPAEAESFAISGTASEPSTSRIPAASTGKVKDAAVCDGGRGIAKPSHEAGAAAHGRAGEIPDDNEKQRVRTNSDVAREMWQAVEKKQYKEMLEKELAGVSPGGDRPRRSTTCNSHAATRQRSRSLPPATVASPTTICKRCRTSRVQGACAVAGICAACQSDMTLLSGKQEKRTPAQTAVPDRSMPEGPSTCAETQADSTRSSGAESGTLGGFLPALLLLKDASLSARYAHIYTHSNLWNGDGSRCMRPEEHTLSATVSRQTSKKYIH